MSELVFQQLRQRCLSAVDKPLTNECFDSAIKLVLSKLPQLEKRLGRVGVAVSGGPDSLSVLAAAVHYFGRERVTAISINHQLPGVNEEGTRISQLVSHFGVDFIQRNVDWPQNVPPITPKIQLQAREVRYQLMGEECRKKGIMLLLLGHCQDDDIGTTMYRMGKASGLDGLAGMKYLLPLPVMHPLAGRLDAKGELTGVFVGRPFLHVPKSQLVATCERVLGNAIYDPSNGSPQFLRNGIVSALRASGIEATRLAHMVETFKKLRAFMTGQVSSLMRTSVVLDRINGTSMLFLNSPHLLQPENKPPLMRTINALLQYSAAVHRPMKSLRLNQLYAQMQSAFEEHQWEAETKRQRLPRQFRNEDPTPGEQTKRIRAASFSLGGGIFYPLSRMHALKRLSLHNERHPNRAIQFGPGFLIQSEFTRNTKITPPTLSPSDYIVYDKRVFLKPSMTLDTATRKWSVEPLGPDQIKMYQVCARMERSARIPLQALLATTPMTHTFQLPVIIAEDTQTEEIVYMAIPTIGAQWTKDDTLRKLTWECVHMGECVLSARFLCLS